MTAPDSGAVYLRSVYEPGKLTRGHVGGLFNSALPRHCSVAGFEVNASLRWLRGPLEDGRLECAPWLRRRLGSVRFVTMKPTRGNSLKNGERRAPPRALGCYVIANQSEHIRTLYWLTFGQLGEG